MKKTLLVSIIFLGLFTAADAHSPKDHEQSSFCPGTVGVSISTLSITGYLAMLAKKAELFGLKPAQPTTQKWSERAFLAAFVGGLTLTIWHLLQDEPWDECEYCDDNDDLNEQELPQPYDFRSENER